MTWHEIKEEREGTSFIRMKPTLREYQLSLSHEIKMPF